MNQNLDLTKMGLMELSAGDSCQINGGSWWSKVVAIVAGGPVGAALAVIGAVEVLQDAVSGFAEGYNYGREHK